AEIQPFLMSHDIYSRGRFGAWQYEISNMDHSVMQGVEVVNWLLLGDPEVTWQAPKLPPLTVLRRGREEPVEAAEGCERRGGPGRASVTPPRARASSGQADAPSNWTARAAGPNARVAVHPLAGRHPRLLCHGRLRRPRRSEGPDPRRLRRDCLLLS